MDGDELGRRVARLRAEGRARAKSAALWRDHPEATTTTAAECVQVVKETLRRFDALRRRRPEPDPLPAWWAARQTGGSDPLAGGR